MNPNKVIKKWLKILTMNNYTSIGFFNKIPINSKVSFFTKKTINENIKAKISFIHPMIIINK